MKRLFLAVLAVVIVMSAGAYGANFPVSYDLRALGRVSPVRNQGNFGTCWAFGVFGALESNYLTRTASGEIEPVINSKSMSGVESEDFDLSELHMAWYLRNDPDKRFHETSIMPRTLTLATIAGASILPAVSYLARLDGPLLEEELPYLSTAVLRSIGYSGDIPSKWYDFKQYPSYELFQSAAKSALGHKLLPEPTAAPDASFDVQLRVTDVLFGSEVPVWLSRESAYRQFISRDMVKDLVMKHGGVSVSYNADGSGRLNGGKLAYYNKGSEFNHEVVIVGWDDTFSKDRFVLTGPLSEDGAWIVKNSWGTDWPEGVADSKDQGYFYMSYCQPVQDGAAFIVENLSSDLKLYQHDPLGWCDAYGEDSTTMYAANVFKVRSTGEVLEGISFYTTEAGATVRWEVYDNGATKPEAGPYVPGATPLASGTETYKNAGYHTKKMTSNIPLGTYFTVVTRVTNPHEKYPLAVERKMEHRSDFAAVHDGESWFSGSGRTGTWWDGVNTYNAGKQIPMNACIKAFTTGGTGTKVTADQKMILGRYLVEYPEAGSVKDVESSKDVHPNRNIPDEPLAARLIYAPIDLSGDTYPIGTKINYWLANVTEAHEFVEAYVSAANTTYPTGMIPYEASRDYDPLFDEGCSPDVFWEAGDGAEYPVYGPFVTSVDEDGYIYLDVSNLRYESGDYGSIPKGYYDFVYTANPDDEDEFMGSLELRLASTNLEPESPDVIYVSRDVPVYVSRDVVRYISQDVVRYVSHDVIRYVSRDVPSSSDVVLAVGSGSGGGCDSGFGLALLVMLAGTIPAMKKR